VSCWIRRIKNPAELVFVLFLLLDPPEYPAELVFCFVFVAGSAGISG
jgi:hypothetical protein